ncbi:MAG: MarR family transcriptional regulator [Myxococcaceae bacterium]|nr:MarR family transcriptional regulator [Myxococcaceae bacterium]
MRTIQPVTTDVQRLKDVLAAFGRRRSLRDPLAAVCEELGLTAPQIHALAWLRLDGPLTMGELSRRIASSEKTITGIVDRLARRSFVQRFRDEADRRVIRAKLTRPGQKVAEKLDEATTHAMELLLGMLEPTERQQLLRILENLHARMQKRAA